MMLGQQLSVPQCLILKNKDTCFFKTHRNRCMEYNASRLLINRERFSSVIQNLCRIYVLCLSNWIGNASIPHKNKSFGWHCSDLCTSNWTLSSDLNHCRCDRQASPYFVFILWSTSTGFSPSLLKHWITPCCFSLVQLRSGAAILYQLQPYPLPTRNEMNCVCKFPNTNK